MRKIIAKYLIPAILLGLTNFSTAAFAASGFPDVTVSHPNHSAILYLQEQGIVQGYEDGTFKPNQLVNRAEFLKIIIEGSDIESNIETETPFPDIDNAAWYAKYVRKAYSEGWINGYPDGTFKPEQTINKVEALKIIGEVQSWSLTKPSNDLAFTDLIPGAWYLAYVNYAKSHDYLEETGSILSPDQLMSRAKISEVIYRTLTNTDNPTEEPSTEDPTPEEPSEPVNEVKLDFTPVTPDTISSSFFTNITLDENIPNTFYKNEIYVIKGSVSGEEETVTIIFSNLDDTNNVFYRDTLTNSRFEIPISFNDTGNFKIGIIPGESGTTQAKQISVLPEITTNSSLNTAPAAATSLSLSFADDTTFVNFKGTNNTLKKIVFKQGAKSKTYLSRQNISKIPIIYKDFSNFKEGQVSFTVEQAFTSGSSSLTLDSAFTKSTEKTFTATTHQYTLNSKDKITSAPPEKTSSVSKISFSGTNQSDIYIEAYVIKPDGQVDSFEMTTTGSTTTYLSKDVLKSGGSFTFEYTPSSTGTYIIEINGKDGQAVLNHPVYIGGETPLLPDYFDLNVREIKENDMSLSEMRTELLSQINESRNELNLPSISLANDLNTLAQAHGQDMVDNDFFGHVNGDGESPQDRRIEAGIMTEVGENLAKDVNITFAHLGLMRSAGHRQNIINSDWTRVGLGIVEDDGYLVVVEEFSYDPLSEADLLEFRNELLSTINDFRGSNDLDELSNEANINSATEYINDQVIDNSRELDSVLFNEALEESGVSGTSEALIRVYNSWDVILNSFLEEETLLNAAWDSFGGNIQLDDIGNINAVLILNR